MGYLHFDSMHSFEPMFFFTSPGLQKQPLTYRSCLSV